MFALALALGIGAFILYFVFWPKPLSNFPHNPITSVLGDLPEILRMVRSGKTLSEYYGLLVERHGPVIQVRWVHHIRAYKFTFSLSYIDVCWTPHVTSRC